MAFTKVLPSGISSSFNLTVDSINSVGVVTATSIVATTGTFSGNVSVAGTLTYEDVTNIDSIGIITARSTIDAQGNVTVGAGLSVVGVSTLGNTVVGGATTELVVTGDARITGILTIGTASITIDGSTGKIDGASLSNSQISAIESTISDTAVDIFVYDTSKDSDGGAWRYKTQRTSWYNETLNTATRGSRREFPAVAVIVSTLTTVTIYDGDDPDMPMWMVFEGQTGGDTQNSRMLQYANTNGYFVHALNGILVVGQKSNGDNYGNPIIRFISEYVNRMDAQTYEGGVWNGNIANRNSTSGYRISASETYIIVNSIINDVAMTVLPNAPIDPSTGLPVPTIAVAVGQAGAANGGVSVIKDDGTVVDIVATTGAGGYASYNVAFGSNNELIHTQAYDKSYSNINIFDNIPSSDISATFLYSEARTYAYISSVPNVRGGVNGASVPNLEYVSNSSGGDIAFGYQNTNAKLSLLSESKTDPTKSSVAYITSDYNTGWMHGDIKGAFLSDTDATNVTGTELVTNGTFDTDTTGWTIGVYTEGAISVDNGKLKILNVTDRGRAFQSGIPVTAGKHYVLQFDAITGSTTGFTHVSGGTATANNIPQYVPFYFYATGSTIDLQFGVGTTTNGDYVYYDNISIREVDPDRSVNNKGLQVFGTVTKSVVATGADLVAYSGFTANDHLRQPPNSDMNIGTGDAHEMIWYKTSSTSNTMMLISYEGGVNGTTDYGKPFNIRMTNGLVRGWASHNGFSTYDDVGHGVSTADGTWHHAAWVKRGQVFELYVDGRFIGSVTGAVGSNALSDANSELVIGGRKRGLAPGTCQEPFNGSLALARIGKSAPSPEQIKKIYEDEKVLFQENAKCTLYGSSDAVTALAYDEVNDLLHVGTSSGRSDFNGLRRINNTTTAVTTAISASNGLIAEQ